MSVLYTNNAKTTLSASLNNSATSLSVASSSGFPSLSGSHYFYATLDDNTNLEVVKVTAVSGTTWTIVRAQDNTTARAYASGDTVELRLNAALLTDVVNDALASSFTRQDFTGNGSTTAFTLNKTPGSESDLIVFIEGVFQNQADYTLSGTTLTFDEAPASSRKIVVYHVSASVSGDSLALNTFSGDGSTTAFTMSVDPLYENNTMVFIDGVYQNKSTYSTSGTTLTFDAAPANGTSIDVTTHTQQTINVPVDGSVSTAKIAADAVTGAKIADDAINSEHYTDGSIDTAHIANLQVTTGKLAADAVTAAKLADDAVVTANITDDAVTTAKIADDQITLAKLAGLARGKIIYGDSSGNPAALALGSNGQVLKSDGTDIAWATDATVAALTSEQVQDIAGAMFSSNTETGITATYQDGDGTIDLVLDAAQPNITSLGTLTSLTVDDITINGSTILDSQILTIDASYVIVQGQSSYAQIALVGNDGVADGYVYAESGDVGFLDDDGNWAYKHDTDTSHQFLLNNSEKMRINSTGVGIGTSSPATNLHIDGVSNYNGVEIKGSGGSRPMLQFSNANNGDLGAIYGTEGNALVFTSGSSNAERMRIDSSGNVMIGITSASHKFMVNQATVNEIGAFFYNNTSTNQPCVKVLQDGAGSSGPALVVRQDGSGNAITVDDGSDGNTVFSVSQNGALSKASGSFKIDHPLEAKKDTHHLVHSFVEAPQADNIYRGTATLSSGTATINLDTVSGMTEGTYVLLNTNTSCFTSNETDWDAVKGSVSGNILTITCQNDSSTATVSWLVIGERHDQHMKDTDWTDDDGKVIVEPLKE